MPALHIQRPGRVRWGAAALAVGFAFAAPAPAGAAVTPLPAEACGAVEYGGTGEPAGIIATDFPLQGASRERSLQMVAGVRLALQRNGWKAGGMAVALQSCDDADAHTGAWTEARCDRNAANYAADPDVFGVVGTYNSGCAARMLPVLNRAGVAMVSPGNTLVCLTESAASCTSDEPAAYAPTGARTYARVVPNDAYQGAALATYAVKSLKAKRIAVLSGGDETSAGQAAAVSGAAKALHVKVVASKKWNEKAKSYKALFKSIAKTKPDAILLAGLTEQNGGQLVRDKVAVLGANGGKVKLLALDGFAQTSTIRLSGRAAIGMFASTPGIAPELLTTALGKQTVADLKALFPGKPVEPFAPYAAQAADVLIAAIATREAPIRGAVPAALFGMHVTNGVIGTFTITPSGDPNPGRVTVSIAKKSAFSPLELVSPAAATVTAARRG